MANANISSLWSLVFPMVTLMEPNYDYCNRLLQVAFVNRVLQSFSDLVPTQ